MKILRWMCDLVAHAYYTRALREINPLHSDVNEVRLKQLAAEDRLRRHPWRIS